MHDDLLTLKENILNKLESVSRAQDLENLRISVFGKSGEFTVISKKLPALPADQKKEAGILLNQVKKNLEDIFVKKLKDLNAKKIEIPFDATDPGIKPNIGHLHAQTIVLNEIIDIFKRIGYQIADGPEIETDYYNFGALNFPDEHPARDTQDTFYLSKDTILRTQTSAMQGRVMEKIKPPVRVAVPGKCFRNEAVDVSHGFEFWQVEGFCVDENIHLTDLFGTIEYVLKSLMGSDIKLRFACTNFPFVEPGVDTYMECTVCKGRGCSFCKNSGWSEIMPAGMIHPNVLKAVGYDKEKYSGFAFAIGLSRVVTLKYQMDDLRLLTNPDLRILEQF